MKVCHLFLCIKNERALLQSLGCCRQRRFLIHLCLHYFLGYTVQSGSRWILAGFTHVDRIDPWTGDLTGLPLWASWLDLAWLHVKFKNGKDLTPSHSSIMIQDLTNPFVLLSYISRLPYCPRTRRRREAGDEYVRHTICPAFVPRCHKYHARPWRLAQSP